MREENYINIKRAPGDIMKQLSQRFGELVRKLWNPRNFKAHVSPHEMLQSIVLCSKKRFQITKQSDPIETLAWFLNSLHLALNGTKSLKSSIVSKTFEGKMKIYFRKLPNPELSEEQKQALLQTEEYKENVQESLFKYLTLDLPAARCTKIRGSTTSSPRSPLPSSTVSQRKSTRERGTPP